MNKYFGTFTFVKILAFRFFALLYPIIMLLLFNVGVGMILSALYVFFRDMRYLWLVLTQFLMYMSAMFYSIDSFPPGFRRLFLFNPIYVFIQYFRQVVINGAIPSFRFHLLVLFYTAFVLCIGSLFYRKYDNEFIYYV